MRTRRRRCARSVAIQLAFRANLSLRSLGEKSKPTIAHLASSRCCCRTRIATPVSSRRSLVTMPATQRTKITRKDIHKAESLPTLIGEMVKRIKRPTTR